MKNCINKIIAGVMALTLAFAMTACGNNDEQAEVKPSEEASVSEEASGEAKTRTITDVLGRTVEIPEKVERIVPLGNASRIATYLGLQDKFVTVCSGDRNTTPYMAYGWFNQDKWADLPVAASGGYGVFHPEVILAAEPDVILCTFEPDIVKSIEEQTGLPVVAVAQGTLFGEDYEQALRIFGDVCGVSDRAEEVISYINGCLDELESLTKDVPNENKPLVLGAGATFRGGHGIDGVYVDYPVFTAIKANDAAVGLDKQSFDTGVEVDKEQILAWDPDYIFIDAGNIGLVNEQYASDPGFFDQLKAVKEGHVYQWPNSTCNYTNVEIPLVGAYYAGSILYPEQFANINFEEKAEEIFKFFLGGEGYLQVLSDNGFGYNQVEIGK